MLSSSFVGTVSVQLELPCEDQSIALELESRSVKVSLNKYLERDLLTIQQVFFFEVT